MADYLIFCTCISVINCKHGGEIDHVCTNINLDILFKHFKKIAGVTILMSVAFFYLLLFSIFVVSFLKLNKDNNKQINKKT